MGEKAKRGEREMKALDKKEKRQDTTWDMKNDDEGSETKTEPNIHNEREKGTTGDTHKKKNNECG